MPRAKYIGVIEDLKTKIASGKLAPGDRIASIREMCDAYDVSSIVALRVFRELSDQGLIEKRDGEGYYAGRRRQSCGQDHMRFPSAPGYEHDRQFRKPDHFRHHGIRTLQSQARRVS
mgnify:CR=1 FL=1